MENSCRVGRVFETHHRKARNIVSTFWWVSKTRPTLQVKLQNGQGGFRRGHPPLLELVEDVLEFHVAIAKSGPEAGFHRLPGQAEQFFFRPERPGRLVHPLSVPPQL